MSSTVSMYTIVSAVAAAEDTFLGKDRVWNPASGDMLQERFLKEVFYACRPDLPKIPEFETVAALSEGPINKFLKDRGFNIQLQPFPKLAPPDRAWGAASVLDISMKWKVTGSKTYVEDSALDGVTFPAAWLPDSTVNLFTAPDHPHPIAGVLTKSDDIVYMTICDEELEYFALLDRAESLSNQKRRGAPYEGLIFPVVDLDHKIDISWLVGMNTYDDENYFNKLTQALQQTKLKMNHEGARIKDAVAVGGVRITSIRTPKPPMVIDRPFLLWVERPGLSRTLFAARITKEHWKDPGTLDM